MRGKKARLLRKQTECPGRGRRLYVVKGRSQKVASPSRRHYQQLKRAMRGAPIGFMVTAHRHAEGDFA